MLTSTQELDGYVLGTESFAPSILSIEVEMMERFAPIMADHPIWVERRVCNTPGCGNEDYFDHILREMGEEPR